MAISRMNSQKWLQKNTPDERPKGKLEQTSDFFMLVPTVARWHVSVGDIDGNFAISHPSSNQDRGSKEIRAQACKSENSLHTQYE